MRDEFLTLRWARYPAAPDGMTDLSDYKGGYARVGGRLNLIGRAMRLESNGVNIEISANEATEWLNPAEGKFDLDLLRDGDLVCVDLEAATVRAVVLLVPAVGEYRLDLTPARARQWADFKENVRGFFRGRGFIEAATPTLVPSPGTEPHLDPFETVWRYGTESRTVYLPTSPEFHLKKMLVAGFTKVFEIKPTFRNGEIGAHHEPEFHMLEWYRAYATLDAIAEDVGGLIAEIAGLNQKSLRATTMSQLFAEAFDGFQLRPNTERDELVSLAKSFKILIDPSDTWDDVFFKLFLERIERDLGLEEPVLVRGYPPSQAALARIGPDGFADRFEVYWRGMEIANAFHELNDPAENERRFREDELGKRALGKKTVPIDRELVRALKYGLPPSGGIALGLERLFMATTGITSIGQTRAFPFQMLIQTTI